MLAEESDVFVIVSAFKRVDLDSERAPVSKEEPQRLLRQLPRSKLPHERRIGDALLPPRRNFPVMLIDKGLGLGGIHPLRHPANSCFVYRISYLVGRTTKYERQPTVLLPSCN